MEILKSEVTLLITYSIIPTYINSSIPEAGIQNGNMYKWRFWDLKIVILLITYFPRILPFQFLTIILKLKYKCRFLYLKKVTVFITSVPTCQCFGYFSGFLQNFVMPKFATTSIRVETEQYYMSSTFPKLLFTHSISILVIVSSTDANP